jgi:Mrp family chromosome partitioning ATPase
MALGGGLVWAYGFLRDGYRHADDLESAGLSAPLLGIIPDLTKPVPGEDEQAALSVHHIRNSLQLQTNAPDDGRGRLFTITSSGAGEGKTHLALALGMSFAMAGKRTLLIDADLVGRALTAQLGLRGSKGLSEAIGAATLNGEVHSARDNLWALPAGAATDFRPEQLLTTRLSQLLEQARGAFDAVIIDSGPIMGSLEANLATSLSDRVVLVWAGDRIQKTCGRPSTGCAASGRCARGWCSTRSERGLCPECERHVFERTHVAPLQRRPQSGRRLLARAWRIQVGKRRTTSGTDSISHACCGYRAACGHC